MIPKILHFVWIGIEANILPYASYVVDKFKKLNPSFDVKLHKMSKDHILSRLNCYDQRYQKLVVKSIDSFVSRLEDAKQFILDNKNLGQWQLFTNIYTLISNQLREELLFEQGGIYCDLDCYPVRPFDQELLSLDSFAMNSEIEKTTPDMFFMGCHSGRHIYDDGVKKVLLNPISSEKNTIINQLRLDGCKLLEDCKFDELDKFIMHNSLNDQYILHFFAGSKYK